RAFREDAVQWKSLSCKPLVCIGKTSFVTDNIDIKGKALRFDWWVLAVIVFGLVIAIRIRLLGIPLERDEGEYAYAGQLMLQGIPPYMLAYNMKFPGTYAAYALIMSIFGQTIFGIHLGLLLVNTATSGLIFLLGRRLMNNSTAGIAAATTYLVLSVSPSVLGLAAHATHFVMLPVLGGTLLFSTGVILPLGIASFFLWRAGVFDKFWFWTIDYARQYGSLIPLSQAPQIFLRSVEEVIGAGWALWGLAGVGAAVGLCNQRMRGSTIVLIGFLFFSALALCPGFHFRSHYFILVLP